MFVSLYKIIANMLSFAAWWLSGFAIVYYSCSAFIHFVVYIIGLPFGIFKYGNIFDVPKNAIAEIVLILMIVSIYFVYFKFLSDKIPQAVRFRARKVVDILVRYVAMSIGIIIVIPMVLFCVVAFWLIGVFMKEVTDDFIRDLEHHSRNLRFETSARQFIRELKKGL